jgi:branched-chain amino acid transport system substrate-binding protein
LQEQAPAELRCGASSKPRLSSPLPPRSGGPPNNGNEIKTAGEFGVLKGGQQMAALLALITDIHSLGLPVAQGLLLTTSFYWDIDDKTREWSKRYFAKMNRMPTMWQAGVYSSVMHYLNAIKESGTDEPLKVGRVRAAGSGLRVGEEIAL